MLDIFTQSEILSTHPSIEGPRDLPEGAAYRYDRRGHELLRIVRGVGPEMVAAVNGEPVEVALLIEGTLVVVCSRVGVTLPWAGAAYHWHRVWNSERLMPTRAIDTVAGSRLDLILLEAAGGAIHVVRSLTLPVAFTQILHEAILDQARYTYNPVEERRAMEALLRRCPTADSLVCYSSVKATMTA